MSSPAADILDDLPPGFNFDPEDEQLIKLYLLPRLRGQPDPFPGLIVEDDTAANTQPWKLFSRHGRADEVQAFFYVRTNDAKGGDTRQDRRCDGGGSWKSQKSQREQVLLVDGEKIKWTRHNLNLQMDRGSVGWVMHEYSITERPSLKICRISFTGHCKKRKRVPDGYDDCLVAGESATQRPRLASADSGSSASPSWTTTTTFDQDFGTAHHASEDQEHFQHLSDDDEIAEMVAKMTDADAQPYMVPAIEQQVPRMEQRVDQETSAAQKSDDEEIAAMIAEMTYTQPQPYDVVCDELVPVVEQQVDQEPNMSDERSYMDLLVEGLMAPSSCCVPNVSDMATGTQGVVTWGGFDFV